MLSTRGIRVLVFLPLLAAAQVPTYSVRTVAGRNGNGDGGLAINALIPAPSDLTMDSAGNIFVTELTGPIRRITPDGVITTMGALTGPQGIVADNAGNLYIAGGCYVTHMDAHTGVTANIAGTGSCTAGADGPALSTSFFVDSALALDLQGGLLIAEPPAHRIRRLDLTANTVTTIAGTGNSGGTTGDGGPAKLADIGQPSSIALDSKGNIFFTDAGNCLLRRIDASSGNISTIAGTAGSCGSTGDNGNPKAAQLGNPRGLLVSPAGNLVYVGEPSGSSRIRLINLDTNTITTVAGNGTAGLSGDGGPAKQAMIGWPWGMVFDKAGNLVFSDYLDGRLRYIDAAQNIHTLAGASGGAGDQGPAVAALMGPSGVVPDGHGGLYIDDFSNRSIRQVVPPGVISTVAGNNVFAGDTGNGGPAVNANLSQSYGFTIDSAGTVYFTESAGVTRMISSGTINQVGSLKLNFPQGIAVDPGRQYLYITEYSGHRVTTLSLSNGIATTLAGLGNPGDSGNGGYNGDGAATNVKLMNPSSIAVDGAGNVYVLDGGNNLIRKINPLTSQLTTVAGNRSTQASGDGGLATQAGIGGVGGLTVDSSGNLFISEGSSIRRVDAITGIINTIAGTGVNGFSGDGGPALQAQFFGAGGMSVDSQGDIFLVDQGNRIRELFPTTNSPQIDAAIVASGFGGGVNIAPGTWMEIYGENLSPTTRTWQTSDFQGTQAPNSLDNVKVLFNGQQGYLDVISKGQINAQVPDGVGTGNVSVQVVSPNGSSNTVVVSSADRAPALLAPPALTANGRFYTEALFLDQTLVGAVGLIPGVTSRPAKAQDTIILYGIGFGAVSPVIPPGTIASVSSALPNVVVKIGGVPATTTYAGQAGNFVGLDELYVTVPSGVTGPDALVSVTVNGVPLQQTLFLGVE